MGEGPSRLSIAVSMGDFQNTKFILGGESPDEFVRNVQTVFGDKSDAVLDKFKKAFLDAPYYDVNRNNSGNTAEGNQSPPPNNGWGSGNSGGNSGGGGGNRQDDGPGRPNGPAPECEHGPKVWVNPNNKDWKGWFCPQKKRAGSCSAEFVND